MAKSKVKKKVSYTKWLVGGVVALSLLLNIFLALRLFDKNRAVKVIDGDSLNLRDGTRIRLLGVDAPETGRCMSYRAKARLEQLALHK